MRRFVVVTLLLLAVLLQVHSQDTAVISDLSGKVEIMTPGGGWVAATKGLEVPTGATISTGFGASAMLDLGSSEIQVKQLTRLTLEELLEQQGTVTTNVFLRVGKVRATVKTGEGLSHDFRLRSPVSTAAVKGTELSYDGFRLEVHTGVVAFFNALSQRRSYGAGESGSTNGQSAPKAGVVSVEREFTVSARPGVTVEEDEDDGTLPERISDRGSISIDLSSL